VGGEVVATGPATDDEAARTIAELQAKLAEKQSTLANEIGDGPGAVDPRIEQQKAEYAKKGFSVIIPTLISSPW
jgi:hypothetical protein